MLGRVIAAVGVGAFLALCITFTITSPSHAGALGILGVFFLLYLVVLSALTFLLLGVSRLVVLFAGKMPLRRPPVALSVRQAYYYGSVVAVLPVVGISLQSVGGVGVYELALLVLLVGIGCVYVSKRVA